MPKVVSEEERLEVARLLCRYSDCFARHDFELGHFDLIQHQISLRHGVLFKEKMRTFLKFEYEQINVLQKMLQAGVIQPSTSEYASAPVLIRKKDVSVYYALDYRQLHSKTV